MGRSLREAIRDVTDYEGDLRQAARHMIMTGEWRKAEAFLRKYGKPLPRDEAEKRRYKIAILKMAEEMEALGLELRKKARAQRAELEKEEQDGTVGKA